MGYLTSPEDYATLRAALRVAVRLAGEMRAVGYPLDDVHVPGTLDDAALDAFIDARVDTMYHYSSTCRMARPDDEKPGVVDDQLLVRGCSNLRIADASIFPSVPATHPQALIYAVAEKCADMILRTE
jgi:choline dehydrogenase-like flavoprotein